MTQGPVLYFALEEKRSEISRHFRDMGASGEEPILIYSDRVQSDAIEQIRALVQENKPVLVVIDPLFRFAKVKDTSAYAEITDALDPILRLSRRPERMSFAFITPAKATARVEIPCLAPRRSLAASILSSC